MYALIVIRLPKNGKGNGTFKYNACPLDGGKEDQVKLDGLNCPWVFGWVELSVRRGEISQAVDQNTSLPFAVLIAFEDGNDTLSISVSYFVASTLSVCLHIVAQEGSIFNHMIARPF